MPRPASIVLRACAGLFRTAWFARRSTSSGESLRAGMAMLLLPAAVFALSGHGVTVAREIAASEPFAPWRAREALPGPEVIDEKALRHFVSRGTSTYFHPVGSCAMGTDADAVVDPDLRVHGLTGVRVADASIMPMIVPVNTNAATIMIGEKAADLIRGAVDVMEPRWKGVNPS